MSDAGGWPWWMCQTGLFDLRVDVLRRDRRVNCW